jgi:hypothetical protein
MRERAAERPRPRNGFLYTDSDSVLHGSGFHIATSVPVV